MGSKENRQGQREKEDRLEQVIVVGRKRTLQRRGSNQEGELGGSRELGGAREPGSK